MLHILFHALIHVVRASAKRPPKAPSGRGEVRGSRELQDACRHLSQLELLHGNRSPLLLAPQSALAERFIAADDWPEASVLLKKAAEIVAATSLNRLEAEAGPGQAERVLRRGVELAAQQHGATHPSVAESLVQLAALHERMGKLPPAETELAQALGIEQAAFGGDHPRIAAVLEPLARVVSAQGRHREAVPLWGRALAIRERLAGSEHPSLVPALVGLARVQAALGQRDEAETGLMRAISLKKRSQNGESLEVQQLLDELEALFR